MEDERFAKYRAEYERLFANNGCPTTLLEPGEIDDTLEGLPVSRLGGRPSLGAGTEWPSCAGCGNQMMMLMQVLSREHEDLKTPVGTDMAQLFWCDHRCSGIEEPVPGRSPYQEQHMAVAFGNVQDGAFEADDNTRVLPARPVCRKPSAAFPSWRESKRNWWGRSFEVFQDACPESILDELERERRLYSSDESKIGGIPGWSQAPVEAQCVSCRNGNWWGFENPIRWRSQNTEFGCSVHQDELILQFGSNDDISLGDAGCLFVLACECGNITMTWDCC